MNTELETLLKSLFSDDEDEVAVLVEPVADFKWILYSCCVYSYAGYNS